VYLAAWLSPLIALVGLLIRNAPANPHRISWTRVVVYISFLTCLAAVLTPGFDLPARTFAGFTVSLLLGYFMIGKLED
jgi:hypothetical protein